ncbi:hypothetical protein PF010_g30566 [Phytophthora fragariae]|uniref:Phenylalanine ammonia-lyase n=1 Tax=Phytophthora fragariae TaxID=53985 RepID=A0A6A3XUQ0_9STRA|nr:hypothetical protein PF003_g34776 [Phytophthora fragariae]KAE8918891.1 hypothetical protein PF009_g30797 [Phytophthora fragariae]KAE9059562.1 hypothetical protein PF010_g30566 [Phytophthora fragariae]KAE9060444.1 hypothetical protein PF007_g30608 [Phytophthora fragariae]KAE9205848.1 hypothetical protein PF002_g20196 [Phytophthora fragariae]
MRIERARVHIVKALRQTVEQRAGCRPVAQEEVYVPAGRQDRYGRHRPPDGTSVRTVEGEPSTPPSTSIALIFGVISDASKVLAKNGLKPVQLGAKEGLAVIYGTQLITSVGAEAMVCADNVANCADAAVALTLEVLCGTVNALHRRIHAARARTGHMLVASRVRTLLRADNPSELFRSHNYEGKVQDAYTLCCAPQVHGIVHDTIDFVRGVLDVAMNSATDNPMVFTRSAEALTVVEHVETVVAIEILAACQALNLLRPLRTTEALETVHALVRTRVPKFDKDRVMKLEIDVVLELVRSGAICDTVAPFLSKLHESGL